MKRFATPWAHFEFFYQWTKLYKKEKKCLADVRQITDNVSFINDMKNQIVYLLLLFD